VYTWRYVADGLGLELFGTGVVRGSEIIQANWEIIEEKERLGSVRFALVVFAPEAGVDVSTDEIRDIAEQDQIMKGWIPRCAVAVVAGQDVQFGLARMWESYVARVGWQTCVFRSRTEAEQWLARIDLDGQHEQVDFSRF
jgi:hypothetical protein